MLLQFTTSLNRELPVPLGGNLGQALVLDTACAFGPFRVRECWTEENTVGQTYSGELDRDGSDHHDLAYFEINSDEDDPYSPCCGSGSQADKGGIPSEPSQVDAAGYLDFAKRIDAVGSATFETKGVATEHQWSNELQKSRQSLYPLAKLASRETTGVNSRFQPAWS